MDLSVTDPGDQVPALPDTWFGTGKYQHITAEPCTHEGHIQCIASAHVEMESTQRFLATIWWVLLQLISESKSYSHLMCGFAKASISSSLLAP